MKKMICLLGTALLLICVRIAYAQEYKFSGQSDHRNRRCYDHTKTVHGYCSHVYEEPDWRQIYEWKKEDVQKCIRKKNAKCFVKKYLDLEKFVADERAGKYLSNKEYVIEQRPKPNYMCDLLEAITEAALKGIFDELDASYSELKPKDRDKYERTIKMALEHLEEYVQSNRVCGNYSSYIEYEQLICDMGERSLKN